MKRRRTKFSKTLDLRNKMQEDFDKFWKTYPRKVGKQACVILWPRIYSVLPPINILCRIVEKHAEHNEWDKEDKAKLRYIPHPRTWLYQRRWEDELDNQPEDHTESNLGINIGSQRRM